MENRGWSSRYRRDEKEETTPQSRTAAFSSPIVSQLHRESFASSSSRRQTAQVEATQLCSLEDNDRKPPGEPDPFNSTATTAVWHPGGGSYDEDPYGFSIHQDEEDVKVGPAHRDDYFPLPEFLPGFLPFEADALHGEMVAAADYPAAPPLGEAQYESLAAHHQNEAEQEEEQFQEEEQPQHEEQPQEEEQEVPPPPPPRALARNAMDRPAVRMRIHRRQQPRQGPRRRLRREPSTAEITACTTRRAREALRVWYERYNELVEYRDKYGDTNVPQKYAPNNALGVW